MFDCFDFKYDLGLVVVPPTVLQLPDPSGGAAEGVGPSLLCLVVGHTVASPIDAVGAMP